MDFLFPSADRNRKRRSRRSKRFRKLEQSRKPANVEEVLSRNTAGAGTMARLMERSPLLLANEDDSIPLEEKSSYQQQTRRPIVSLAFVLPLILAYELCSILWGSEEQRSGIDQWLEQAVSAFGFGQHVILPMAATTILIVLHHQMRDTWTLNRFVIPGMILESAILGAILFSAANASLQLMGQPLAMEHVTPSVDTASFFAPGSWESTMASVGSGIYEELIFRLILLLPAILVMEKLLGSKYLATIVGVALVSLLFTGLHYNILNPAGETFNLASFGFRFSASLIFCFLFLFRGFGIAVGTHVAYDILAQV